MSKKIALILTFLLMFLNLPIVFAQETPIDAQNYKLQRLLTLLATQQIMYAQCRNDYPAQMQQRYGDEKSALEALAKVRGFDKDSEVEFYRTILTTNKDQFDALQNKIKNDFQEAEFSDNQDMCDDYLIQRTGTNTTLERIIYDDQSLDFYFKIESKWFVGQIDGDDLSSCECDKETSTALEKQKKRKNFIEKAKQLNSYVSDFYMSHNDYGKAAHMFVNMKKSWELSSKQYPADDSKEIDDFGLNFIEIKPINKLPDDASFKPFFEFKDENNLIYECKINYMDQSQTSCFEGML